MRVGLCGYPGSGKSTVFVALAPGAPTDRGGIAFGNIKVPDARVDRLAEIFKPKKKTYAEVTFVDVAGGGRASSGALSADVVQQMRNTDVLVHVVRAFESPMHADPPDAGRDERLFNDELVLLDMQVLERRQARFKKEGRKDQEAAITDRCVSHLENGQPLRTLQLTPDEMATFTGIQLLSTKPLISLYNLSEAAWGEAASAELREIRERGQDEISLGICGAIEAEIAGLAAEEQAEFLDALGIEERARDTFVRAAYRLLDLVSFLTAGPDECRAWPIRRGTVARRAAGKIHSDIERGFIRAEVYRLEDLDAVGTEAALKSAGKIRLEGKEYVIQDGDVVNFRFNV